MKRLISGLCALALLCGGVASAFADGIPSRSRINGGMGVVEAPTTFSWTGIYGGGGVNLSMVSADTTFLPDVQGGPLANVDGAGFKGVNGDLTIGYDQRLGSSPFVLGAFATWAPDGFGDADFSARAVGDLAADATLSKTFGFGAKAGVIMANGNLLYAGYKYQMAELSISASQGNSGVSQSRDTNGHGIFAGLAMPLWTGPVRASLNFEGGYTFYESTNFDFGTQQTIARVKPEELTAGVRLNVYFGGN